MKRVRFPKRIKRGSCVVTIYRTPTNGYASYTVVHYDSDGARCRKTFAEYKQARSAALEVAETLSEGKSDMLVLTGEDLLVYRRAMQALRPMRTSLDTAALRFVEMTRQPNGSPKPNGVAPGQEAGPAIKSKLAAEVLKELLAAKTEKGRSQLYVNDLRVRLTRFADATARPLAEVMATDIDGFLRSLEVSARSQNNFRAAIGTLFRFAQKRGYVPREHPCVSNVEKASHATPEIQVFAPEEMGNLLSKAKPALVPVLALGAFAGVRSEEIKRLDWSDIKLRQGHIEIKSAKSKTKVRRLIPISRNLKAWLAPHAEENGRVTPFANLALQFAKLGRATGVKWQKNGLRHSFISYRVAQVRDVPRVALEAGNSPAVIARNYLKHVTRSEAKRWFGIFPSNASTVTAVRRTRPEALECSFRISPVARG
ncbi:MAG TPA: site-specific integrase [Verrucomicrobiae bacterium]